MIICIVPSTPAFAATSNLVYYSPGFEYIKHNANRVITTTSTLYVRTGPGTNYSKKGYYSGGTPVYVSRVTGNWGYVPEAKGYICLDYTKPVKDVGTGSETFYIYTKSGCNVRMRKGPSTNFDIITSLPKGAVIYPACYYGNWSYVLYKKGGKTYRGWVCSDYISYYYKA